MMQKTILVFDLYIKLLLSIVLLSFTVTFGLSLINLYIEFNRFTILKKIYIKVISLLDYCWFCFFAHM